MVKYWQLLPYLNDVEKEEFKERFDDQLKDLNDVFYYFIFFFIGLSLVIFAGSIYQGIVFPDCAKANYLSIIGIFEKLTWATVTILSVGILYWFCIYCRARKWINEKAFKYGLIRPEAICVMKPRIVEQHATKRKR